MYYFFFLALNCNCFGFGTSADAFWWMRMTVWLVMIQNTIVSGLLHFEIFSLQLQGLTLFGVKIIVSIFFFTSINYELFFS